jgi:hypothetical protein
MFSRISRYRALPDIITTDAEGRTLLSKVLRPLSPAPGTFRHTMEDADRLDHLAYKYYRQPSKWWRISDANPEFLSPLALVGKEPIVTDRFPLEFDGEQPPWAGLVRNLRQQVGVEKVEPVEEIRFVQKAQSVGRRRVILHVEQFERAILVTYNQLNTSDGELAGIITASGFAARAPERLGRLGKQIIIPRDIAV